MASPLAYKDAADGIAKGYLIDKDTEACRDTLCAIVAVLHDTNKNKNLNPNDIPGFGRHTASYLVHRLASETKSWYGVLGLKEGHGGGAAGVEEINKHYEVLSTLFQQPNMCSFVEAKNANKLVTEAWEVLSDARRKEAYDLLMGFTNRKNNNIINVQFFKSSETFRNPSSASSSTASSPLPLLDHRAVTRKIVKIRRPPLNRQTCSYN